MNIIMVGYDLRKPGQEYAPLIAWLKTAAKWWHCLDSTWLIRTPLTATQVRDAIKPLVDSSDEVLVLNVTGDRWAWIGFDERCGTWIKDNLTVA